jgi:lysophospholipase L1-like esterase
MLPIHRLLASYCARNGIEFYDLFGAFKGMRDRDLWVHPSDQHPNVRAHQIAAEAIARFIEERRLLYPHGS